MTLLMLYSSDGRPQPDHRLYIGPAYPVGVAVGVAVQSSVKVRGRVSWLLCAFVLAFAFAFGAAQSPAETTIYVGKHFELREHDAPVKYVFNGSTRVARVTGSLSTNERIQRLRLRAGWNLVSLAVTAPDFPGQLEEFTSGPVPVIQALYRWQPATSDYRGITSGESVAAGTVLWMSAQTDAVVAVRGGYVEPSQWGVPVGDTFVAVPALEAQPLQLPAGVTVWRYDAPNRRWQVGLTGDLSSVSDLPSMLAPGDAIYVHAIEPADLGAPAPEERIRYYHQDHLGSSSAMTDASGGLVEETAFYPFGIPRHEHRLRQVEEPYTFTQKERDRESGLHHFEARYLAGAMSRFPSVDPMYANSESSADDPQALNLYAYVRNNPLAYTDPTGLDRYSEIANAAALSDTRAAAKSDGASFSAGIGDALLDTFTPYPWIYEGLLGGTRIGPDLRGALGIENVDMASGAYGGGDVVGTVISFVTGAGEARAALKGGTSVAKALSKGGSAVDPLAKTQIGGPFAKTIVPAAKEAVTAAESVSTAAPKLVPQVISPKTQWIQGMGNQTQAGRQAMWPFQTPLQRQESLSVIFDFAETLFKGPK